MPPLELDEEVKGRKRLKSNFKNLLTRLLVLLAQIKSEKNSYGLKTKLDKYYIFCTNTVVLHQITKSFTIIESSHYNNGSAYWRGRTCNNNIAKDYSFQLI